MFKDRKDAGRQLAMALQEYRNTDVLVLAIPCGGVEIGYYVARHLNAKMSIVVVRKLPFPHNPEAGFGAVAEDGSTFYVEPAVSRIKPEQIEKIMQSQQKELQRRIKVLRNSRPLPTIEAKKIILVDDGIAMGSTMQAAIKLCKNKKAAKIIVASPVSSPETEKKMQQLVDQVVILEKPHFFQAVAQVYENWYDVSDNEVIEIINRKK